MKETLKLRKPLTINGKKVKELTYDFEEIDGNLWDEAAQRSNKSDRNYNIAMYDYIFHKNLFYAAVIAVNPEISWEDLDRITGFDIQSVANTGLFFYHKYFGGIRPRDLRKRYREYSKAFYTSVRELRRMTVSEFLKEYQEAAEEQARENEELQKKIKRRK